MFAAPAPLPSPPAADDLLPPFPNADRAARADFGLDFIWLFSASASWRSRSSFFMARSLSLCDLRNSVLLFSSDGSTVSELVGGGSEEATGLPKTRKKGEDKWKKNCGNETASGDSVRLILVLHEVQLSFNYLGSGKDIWPAARLHWKISMWSVVWQGQEINSLMTRVPPFL